jgi:hypothetical protein
MMVIEHSKYQTRSMIHFSFKKSYGGSIFSFSRLAKGEELDDDLAK